MVPKLMGGKGTSFTSTKATCYVQRKQTVHIDASNSFTSTRCERNGWATEHVQPNAYLFEENMRTPVTHRPFEINGFSGSPKRFDVLTTY